MKRRNETEYAVFPNYRSTASYNSKDLLKTNSIIPIKQFVFFTDAVIQKFPGTTRGQLLFKVTELWTSKNLNKLKQ